MVSIRGAICIEKNDKAHINECSKKLVETIIIENNIDIDQIVSIIFSATKDINAAYPAPSVRELGIYHAGIMCFQEMDVVDSMPMCIRVLMLVNQDRKQNEVQHVYLNGAQKLRPDLTHVRK